MKEQELKNAFKAAFPTTIPVLTGFLTLGIAYGILMETKGYNFLWSGLMSAVCFCGSMQFAAITMLTTAFDPVGAFLLSILVNARHLFYGLSFLEKYKGMVKIKFILIYLLCDETFSIVSVREPSEDINRKYYYFFISVLNYIYWVMGTVMGGLAGGLITFNTKGLDFALTALFVVLFAEQMKDKKNYILGFIGIACTVVSRLVFGADNLVIPAMVMILCILVAGRKKLCR